MNFARGDRSMPNSSPFSDAELERLFDRHDVTDSGRSLVGQVRSSPPSRSVRPGRGHVTGAYPSRKMGCTLGYESYVELAYFMECEFSPVRIEVFDQPCVLTLRYRGKGAHPVTTPYTPDALQISEAFVGFVECKPDEDLSRLARERPGRWSQDSDGTWRSIPAEQAAAQYGLGYRVRSSSSFQRTLLDNQAFLQEYWVPRCPPVGEDDARQICEIVARRIGLTLEDLIHATANPEAVYTMIASGVLYADLSRHFLSQPHLVLVFGDAQSSRVWDAAHACEVGGDEAFDPRAPISDAAALKLHGASEADRQVALSRYEAIRPVIEGTGKARPRKGAKRRTLQGWVSRWRRAELDHGSGLIGLLPQVHLRGNRVPRLEPQLYALMDAVAEEVYEQPSKPPMIHAYADLSRRCDEAGLVLPSYPRFVRRLKARLQDLQTERRDGYGAAVAAAPALFATADSFARHGQRPFDILHIDHTKADLLLRLGGFTFFRPERVWLTLAHCAWSAMPVGYALSFDPPSYVSCMLVLRDVVCRHQRLPRVIVVDNASEFDSIAFDQLLAAYGVEKRHRPPGEPRYGAACERFFGTANTQFIHTLSGNTQHLRDPRGMSSDVDPRGHVVWTLPDLDRCLEEYLFRIYPEQPQPDLGGTPRERFTQGLELMGARLHRRVPYDQKFFLLSLPASRRGVATVNRRKGVQVEGVRYNAPALGELAGRKVHVRVDPEDAGHVYVHARPAGSWIECYSELYRTFRGASRRLLRLATLAHRGICRRGAKTPRVTAAILAPFVSGVHQHEELERQRLRDAARRPSPTPDGVEPAVGPPSDPDSADLPVDAVLASPGEGRVSWSDLPPPKEPVR